MYGKIKRSIAKLILVMGMAAVLSGLLGLTSPAQAGDATMTSASSASDTNESLDTEVSEKSDAATVSGDVEDVLTANAGFIGKSKKVKACKAYAEKLEQRAPPRDPQAFCSGTVKVKLFGKIVASCPTGYLGAKMTLGVSLRQVVKARAFAKSVASGRVRTWARIKIRDLAKIKGKTYIECVKIPTPPPPVVEYDKCPDIPGNQPADYVCNPTPPPPPPPTETYAPTMDASAGVCVAPGGTSGVINVTGTNKDNVTRTLIFTAPGKAPVEKTVSAGSTESVSFSGFAPGSYTVKVEVKETGKFATKTVTVIQCETPVYNCPPGTTWTDIDKDGIREEGECFGPPTFTQFREFNDLYHSLPGMPTTMDHFVTVDTPAGHSYTITWEAVWGSFATPTKTGQDGVQVSSTYTAPSEVPPAHPDMGLAAGYDKITVTVVDNVTGQRVVRSTAPFRIKAWPSD